MTTQTNKKPGCITAIFAIFKPTKKPEHLPYQLRKSLLTPAEFSFYKVLSNLVQKKIEIQCKVRLGDIFHTQDYYHNINYANKINQKHIDFLLCDPNTMKPILGIELDDASHNKPKRQERDHFVDNIFKTAELPILHIPAKQAYNPREVSNQISEALNKKENEKTPS